MVDSTLYAMFRDELLNGEEILWAGKPDPALIFSKSDAFAIPFSIFWAGSAIFWEASVIENANKSSTASTVSWGFPLFGVPFVLMGLYLLVGRFFYKVWKKKRTHYAITNKRILVVKNTRHRDVQGAYLDAIPIVNKTIRNDGRGTITFGNFNRGVWLSQDSGLDFLGSSSIEHVPTFSDIQDAERVYRLVMDLRKSHEPY